MKYTFPIAAAILALTSAAQAQTLPDITAQDFSLYQSGDTGVMAIYPTIGFHPEDMRPSADDTVFLNSDGTIRFSFEAIDWSGLGSPFELLREIQQDIRDSGYAVHPDGGGQEGTVIGWSGRGLSGKIKVVFLQDCPLAAVLRMEYPTAQSARMEPYFDTIAPGFDIGPSRACPAELK